MCSVKASGLSGSGHLSLHPLSGAGEVSGDRWQLWHLDEVLNQAFFIESHKGTAQLQVLLSILGLDSMCNRSNFIALIIYSISIFTHHDV